MKDLKNMKLKFTAVLALVMSLSFMLAPLSVQAKGDDIEKINLNQYYDKRAGVDLAEKFSRLEANAATRIGPKLLKYKQLKFLADYRGETGAEFQMPVGYDGPKQLSIPIKGPEKPADLACEYVLGKRETSHRNPLDAIALRASFLHPEYRTYTFVKKSDETAFELGIEPDAILPEGRYAILPNPGYCPKDFISDMSSWFILFSNSEYKLNASSIAIRVNGKNLDASSIRYNIQDRIKFPRGIFAIQFKPGRVSTDKEIKVVISGISRVSNGKQVQLGYTINPFSGLKMPTQKLNNPFPGESSSEEPKDPDKNPDNPDKNPDEKPGKEPDKKPGKDPNKKPGEAADTTTDTPEKPEKTSDLQQSNADSEDDGKYDYEGDLAYSGGNEFAYSPFLSLGAYNELLNYAMRLANNFDNGEADSSSAR